MMKNPISVRLNSNLIIMNKPSIIISVLFTFFCNNIFSQDIIITKSGEQIKAKIIEVGKTEIKFKYFDNEDGPIISMNKDEVKTLQLQGKDKKHTNTINIKDDPMSISNDAIKDKTSSLKLSFFSPLFRNLSFGYEWMFKPGFNFEVGAGIIGISVGDGGKKRNMRIFKEENITPEGYFVKAGAKFFLGNSSDFVVEGLKYAHPLKGRYLKPEIIYCNFTRTSTVTETDVLTGIAIATPVNLEKSYSSFAINIIYGRQLILGNSITAGYYVGAGYGFENVNSNAELNYYFNTQRYSHRFISKNHPFTITAGVNVGIILKSPGWLTKNPPSNMENKYNINKKNVEQIEKRID